MAEKLFVYIGVFLFFAILSGTAMYSAQQEKNCRNEWLAAKKTLEEANKICKIPEPQISKEIK